LIICYKTHAKEAFTSDEKHHRWTAGEEDMVQMILIFVLSRFDFDAVKDRYPSGSLLSSRSMQRQYPISILFSELLSKRDEPLPYVRIPSKICFNKNGLNRNKIET